MWQFLSVSWREKAGGLTERSGTSEDFRLRSAKQAALPLPTHANVATYLPVCLPIHRATEETTANEAKVHKCLHFFQPSYLRDAGLTIASSGRVRNVCQGSKQAMRQGGRATQQNAVRPPHPLHLLHPHPPEFTTQYTTTNERARARYTGGKHADGRKDDGASTCMHNRGARFRSSAK